MAEEAPFERWQLEAAKHCAPLFIQDAFLSGGHDATTRNASATFVWFENRYFACTCRHAVELVQKRREVGSEPFATLMLAFNRTFNPLTFITAEGLIDLVQVVPPGSEHYLDLAIADVTALWPTISAEAQYQPIDMDPDKWREPRWARAEMLAAAGWPETEKRNATVNGEPRLIGTITLIVANKSSDIAKDQRIVLMRSTLDEPHNWFFSGISGGPMYVIQEDRIIPVAITFEGWPQTEGDHHEELTDRDIMVRGLTLTPDNFKSWLIRAGLRQA